MSEKLLSPSSPEPLAESDLHFIKKKLRYPINNFRKAFPFIFFLVFMLLMSLLFYAFISAGTFVRSKWLVQLFPFLLGMGVTTIGMIRYYSSLFFERKETGLTTDENITLLKKFFTAQSLRYHTMAGYPDVLLIHSVMNSQGTEQEIVVFIATESKLLVNSHIATSNIFPKSKRKYKELVAMLQSFLSQNQTGVTRHA